MFCVCVFSIVQISPSIHHFFFPQYISFFFFLNLYRNIYIFFFSVSCPAERLPQARRPEIISSQSRRFQVSKCCFVDVYCNNYTVVVQCVFSNCIIIIIFFLFSIRCIRRYIDIVGGSIFFFFPPGNFQVSRAHRRGRFFGRHNFSQALIGR